MTKKFTKKEFIEQARRVHGDLYDYSKVEFISISKKVCIIDPKYGEFWQRANAHISQKQGHPFRGRKKASTSLKLTQEEFIKRARAVHSDLYDYSKVEYTGATKKVCIIDPVYGEFWQSASGHINQKQGHPERGKKRAANKRRMGKAEFIRRAKEKHGNLYDYSKVVYTHIDAKVCIIDPEYGEFWQSPYQHLKSHGCPARTAEKRWVEHVDHIIPITIVYNSRMARHSKWFKQRPLYKFLDSDINKQRIPATENRNKTDLVSINGIQISAALLRNNYEVIEYLIREQLNVDPTDVIKADQEFIRRNLKI